MGQHHLPQRHWGILVALCALLTVIAGVAWADHDNAPRGAADTVPALSSPASPADLPSPAAAPSAVGGSGTSPTGIHPGTPLPPHGARFLSPTQAAAPSSHARARPAFAAATPPQRSRQLRPGSAVHATPATSGRSAHAATQRIPTRARPVPLMSSDRSAVALSSAGHRTASKVASHTAKASHGGGIAAHVHQHRMQHRGHRHRHGHDRPRHHCA